MTTEDTTPTGDASDGVTPASTPENASGAGNAPGAASGSERPFGFWITAVDRLLRAEFATAFEREGITRRDWRLLNLIDGTVAADRPLRAEKLRRLVELGWVAPDGDGWTLTDEGRAAKDRLGAIVDDIRVRVAGAVDPEEFAVMASSLERIARELGWHEGMRLPRTGRGGFGFARFARLATRHGFAPGALRGPHGEGHGFPHAGFSHRGFRHDGLPGDRHDDHVGHHGHDRARHDHAHDERHHGGHHRDAHPDARHDGPADGHRRGHAHGRRGDEAHREYEGHRDHRGHEGHRDHRAHRGHRGLHGRGLGPHDGQARHLHIHLHD